MSNARPNIEGASVEKIGDNRYEATLTPEKTGIYFIGDYGIAVNYPLEYREIRIQSQLGRTDYGKRREGFHRERSRKKLVI